MGTKEENSWGGGYASKGIEQHGPRKCKQGGPLNIKKYKKLCFTLKANTCLPNCAVYRYIY